MDYGWGRERNEVKRSEDVSDANDQATYEISKRTMLRVTPSLVPGNKVRACHWKKRGNGRSEQTAFGISMGKKIMHSSLDELDSRSLCMATADDTRQKV